MVVCQNGYVTVTWNRTGHYLEIVWSGAFTPSKQLRPIFGELGRFVQAKKPLRWLCDHSGMKIISPEDQKWLLEEWIPGWREAGRACVRRLAVVKSSDLFGQISTENLTRRIRTESTDIDVRQFERRAEADAWLLGKGVIA